MAGHHGTRFHGQFQTCDSVTYSCAACHIKIKMTSKERHEARYQRRKAKREHRLLARALKYTKWDDIYGLMPLVEGYKNAAKSSKRKRSTQNWMANLALNARRESRKLAKGIWKSRGYHRFKIKERGKWRDIQSAHISEKGIQNSFVNNCYVPIIEPHLIYDNGASLKNKGTDFSMRRFIRHLRDRIRKHGRNGYIYFFDFSSYFATIDQDKLIAISKQLIWDKRVMKTYETYTRAFGSHGIGLGSPVSQISALLYPNSADHLIKDRFGIRGYGRHMDDGYIICESYAQARLVSSAFRQECERLGIIMNPKKCFIIRMDQPFKFLKTRFFITESGKIVARIGRQAIKKERHRLRCYRKFYDMKLMGYREIFLIFHSWIMSLNRKKLFHVYLNMIRYFNRLFPEYNRYTPPVIRNRKQKQVAYAAHMAKVS